METDAKQSHAESAILQLVTFRVGREEYGLDILNVREINKVMEFTRVPEAPEYIEGIINLRGQVIPVIDLRKILGLEKQAHDKDTRVVVVDIAGKTFGITVDGVKEVLRISDNITEPPPDITQSLGAGYVTAVAKLDDRLLFLLDVERITSLNYDADEARRN